ncbi:MAG: response regulator, partial [Candidatus Latescibacterota bacterium]
MDTILVVDDCKEDREIASRCLQEHGVKTLFAENGREALKILAKQRLDAVLTDLHMPEMDGLQLVERMRLDYSNVPVVVMTAVGTAHAAAA